MLAVDRGARPRGHHDRHHRAHDARHGAAGRPLRRARSRRVHRRGRAREQVIATAGDRSLSRQELGATMLKLDALTRRYGGLRALATSRSRSARASSSPSSDPTAPARRRCSRRSPASCRRAPAASPTTGTRLRRRSPPRDRPHLGIAHVPEGRQVFRSLTVLENLEMGATRRRARASLAANLERIFALFPLLAERPRSSPARCRAASSRCWRSAAGSRRCRKLLMLDEPSMGLAPAIADQIFERIEQIHREQGITILLVEQRVAEALEPATAATCSSPGASCSSGNHDALLRERRASSRPIWECERTPSGASNHEERTRRRCIASY